MKMSMLVTLCPAGCSLSSAPPLINSAFSDQAHRLLASPVVTTLRLFMSTAPVAAKPLLLLAFVSCLSMSGTPLLAAPANSEELSGGAEVRGSAGSLTGTGGGAVPVVPSVPQSKTVELLLQMQDQPQAPGGDERSGTGASRRAAPIASAPKASPTGMASEVAEPTPLGALKNAILRDAAPRAAETTTTETTGPTPGSLERQSASVQGSGDGTARKEPGQSLLSHPVIQYIRENRVMVVSISLGVLAAIWLTASFSMRRDR